jgi:chorismate synthase
MNTFGHLFRITTWGESHGGAVGVVVDGCPPRVPIIPEAIQFELDRRRPGQSKLVTQRKETDTVHILSGVFEGQTLGTPILMLVWNEDARPEAYESFKDKYRPSHADYTYHAKYGIRSWQGGGRSSARETIGRVAAGAIAKKVLEQSWGAEVLGWVEQVHHLQAEIDPENVTMEQVESNPVRCPDPEMAAKMIEHIEEIRKQGNSVGGVIRCVARGVPVGWGDPVFDKLEANLAKAVMSLPASKGFEIGSGFRGVAMTGLEHNDEFYTDEAGRIRTRTNFSGGVQGGISNGELIDIRVAFKPTATIFHEQNTVNEKGQPAVLKAKGRHDPCVLPRAVPMVEAMVALVLVDHALRHKAQNL